MLPATREERAEREELVETVKRLKAKVTVEALREATPVLAKAEALWKAINDKTITFTALQDTIKHCRSKFEGCNLRNELADAAEWLQALQHLEARVTEWEANAKREAQEEKDKVQAARIKDAAAKKARLHPRSDDDDDDDDDDADAGAGADSHDNDLSGSNDNDLSGSNDTDADAVKGGAVTLPADKIHERDRARVTKKRKLQNKGSVDRGKGVVNEDQKRPVEKFECVGVINKKIKIALARLLKFLEATHKHGKASLGPSELKQHLVIKDGQYYCPSCATFVKDALQHVVGNVCIRFFFFI